MVSTSYILLNYKQIFINVLLPGVCDLNLHLPWTTMVSISYILLNYKKIFTNALLSVVCILNLHLPWTTMVSISKITEVDIYIYIKQ